MSASKTRATYAVTRSMALNAACASLRAGIVAERVGAGLSDGLGDGLRCASALFVPGHVTVSGVPDQLYTEAQLLAELSALVANRPG